MSFAALVLVAGMQVPYRVPSAEEESDKAVVNGWPCWGYNVEAGSHGLGRPVVDNRDSCLRHSYRCDQIARTPGAGVEPGGASWVEVASKLGETVRELDFVAD